ncbi:MAG: class I SAM-dependent methyltransferase, partial [bacterium]|nr:class I SAM-dependent methyltransferase [bacterium]
MSAEPLSVIMIGDPLPYADGAESELSAIIEAAEDRRVGSDDLAGAIRDWPTAYHLAPERAVLLDPVAIGSNDRVLDVGAGSGVNTRLCADRGAAVTAVEGSEDRARLIAHRCAGLDGVEVLCGSLHDLGHDRQGEFDVVLAVGVLEYAGTAHGGGRGPDALLRRLVDALAPGGVVVLAIENRLGLKYLLGFPEDHLGLPWAGLEESRPGEPTTWSRRELAQMLDDVGLSAQKWLYPFPDYKLPTAVLAEEAYDQPHAADLVDQIVGHPTSSQYFRPVLIADDRAAHRSLLAAGLGRDVANSFLVVAGRDPQAVADRVDGQALAWWVAPDRRRRWRQKAVVVDSDEGLIVKRRLMAGERAGEFEGWLGQVEVSEEPFYLGRDLEQCLLDCAREGDADGIAELLREWRAVLAANEVPLNAVAEPHPYLPADTVRALPPEWLDAGPDNFVATAEGLKFVDREWHAAGGVDVRLAVVRGLWKTVSAMLSARCH